jgi:streptogramin lyase/mono/diheme cytochrome c family protein
MINVRSILLASAASLVIAGLAGPALAADQLLTGAISSAAGEKLGGVTVSAKLEGSTITTSVYTDESGNYYFPPLPAGKYQVWAQALGFESAKGAADLAATAHQNFTLQPITDPDARIHQLPSELLVAALPEDTADDARIKKVFTNQCTGCHTPGYPLQFKFDEAGWNKIINLMKVIPGTGVYPGAGAKPNGIIDYNQKELAAYLARARGPGESSMKFTPRPRPTGEAARVVWTTYEVPLNPDAGIGTQVKYNPNDGSDWSLGTTSKLGELPHDGGMGLDGNLYFTSNNPNKLLTIGKIDAKTGALTPIKEPGRNGNAATAHGLVRDGEGNFWFDVNPGRRALGKLDTKTDQITVYQTPNNMTPLGGAVTMDVDGKGKIWASAPNGVLRFDPVTETFTEFKSATPFKFAKGTNSTYGAAGDRDGNGWWAQMAIDTIGKADVATQKTSEVALPELKDEEARLSPAQKTFYDNFNDVTNGNPLPWSEGPRRMGTDKNADVLWVGDSWGASLARINTHTMEATIIPFPDKTMQAYHLTVDQNHRVWGNLWTSDRIVRYDPANSQWTMFDLPVHGTEIRHISLMERDGKTQVIVPVYRASQMGVMTLRSEAELADLKSKVQ